MCELTTSQKHIITELNNSRGEYKPAFMQIRIHDSMKENKKSIRIAIKNICILSILKTREHIKRFSIQVVTVSSNKETIHLVIYQTYFQ